MSFCPVTYSRLLALAPCCRSVVRFIRGLPTPQPKKPSKLKASGYDEKQHFVDFKKVRTVGGSGGNGVVSFLRLYANEFAGPDGGDGGHGGHIIFQATPNEKSLNGVPSVIIGNEGVNGSGKNCDGKNAEHKYVKVPVGTIFRDETGQLMTSLDEDGEYYVASRGGAGGHGNHFFISSENTTPQIAEEGAKGEDRIIYVELRTMADAGLIGFPNAGKSTLLRAMSRARPKVAPYPFTTLHPHVGQVEYDDYVQIAVADIPGLIKDAHKNKGLGFQFLRHIERCTCLLYVIDLSVEEPWMQLEDLKFELEQYKSGLSERPHAVIGNKIDLPLAQENLISLKERIDLPVFAVSAKQRINITELLMHLRYLYDNYHSDTENS